MFGNLVKNWEFGDLGTWGLGDLGLKDLAQASCKPTLNRTKLKFNRDFKNLFLYTKHHKS